MLVLVARVLPMRRCRVTEVVSAIIRWISSSIRVSNPSNFDKFTHPPLQAMIIDIDGPSGAILSMFKEFDLQARALKFNFRSP